MTGRTSKILLFVNFQHIAGVRGKRRLSMGEFVVVDTKVTGFASVNTIKTIQSHLCNTQERFLSIFSGRVIFVFRKLCKPGLGHFPFLMEIILQDE
jgi:hypothetical protein